MRRNTVEKLKLQYARLNDQFQFKTDLKKQVIFEKFHNFLPFYLSGVRVYFVYDLLKICIKNALKYTLKTFFKHNLIVGEHFDKIKFEKYLSLSPIFKK